MINLDVDFLQYSTIAEFAEKFLKSHNINTLPVPIEEVIDVEYGIDIIPTPGLLSLHSIDGFITHDFSRIYIDQFVQEQRPYRYRFTLAHEIGHYIMHKDYLDMVSLGSIDEWRQFIEEINPDDHSKMEYQGYSFAGLVLVPPNELAIQFNTFLPEVEPLIAEAKSEGISRDNYLEYAKDKLAALMAPVFQVSTDVIIRRIDFDRLSTRFP